MTDRGSGLWLLDGVSTARGVGMIPGCRGRAGIASTGGVWRWFVRGVVEVFEVVVVEFVRGVVEVFEVVVVEFVRGVVEVFEVVDGPPCMSHERSRAERSR
jgi:hypothetical protein